MSKPEGPGSPASSCPAAGKTRKDVPGAEGAVLEQRWDRGAPGAARAWGRSYRNTPDLGAEFVEAHPALPK